MNRKELKRRQALPLDDQIIDGKIVAGKITLSKEAIRIFYETLSGKVVVAFSGGKDSTALLHLVRSIYPDVKVIFCDTGLEHPENRAFVKTFGDSVEWIKPKMSFFQVIQKYGYPLPTKEQAKAINELKNSKSVYMRRVRNEGKPRNIAKFYKKYLKTHPNATREEHYQVYILEHPNFRNELWNERLKVSEKWKFLTTAVLPNGEQIKVSDKCCNVLKKSPAESYCKEHGLFEIIGDRAEDSNLRTTQYLKTGCNAFMAKKVKSTPIAFWTEKDIWDYIHRFNLPYSKAYLEVGCERTGCIFCMFGITEEPVSRFAILKQYHPQLYDYCMNKLGLKDVFDLLEKQGIKLPYPYPQPHP